MATFHIIGGGMAGLSCATTLARRGAAVRLYEAAPQAGGRCRSYHDSALDHTIDNGNHLLLSGNRATLEFLSAIGAADRLVGPAEPIIPFIDLETLTRWRLHFGAGRLPWWIFRAHRRVPGTQPLDYLALLPLLRKSGADSVADRAPLQGPIFDRFLEPMVVAVMNETPQNAAALPFARVLRETFLAGGPACRPLVAARSLADTFVDPALAFLTARGAVVRFGARARRLEIADGMVKQLHFGDEAVALAPDDRLVLAVPPSAAEALLPTQPVPEGDSSILNLHFRTSTDGLETLFAGAPLLGLVNGMAQWVFKRDGLISVTVSAADALIDEPAEILAPLIWQDLARAFGRDSVTPPFRVVKEKRATFRQTSANEARRPTARTAIGNLFLAGDWTATGLPATIEGAVRSGVSAAEAALTFVPAHGVAAAALPA
jgi:squalene-associated FAD-dependent desaturase